VKRNILKVAAAILILVLTGFAYAAETFPSKPVRLLVGFAPGGGTDLLTRALAQELTQELGQSVIVENRSGANGYVATIELRKSPPDGYTIMMAISSFVTNPLLSKHMVYDAVKDFTPIAMVSTVPYILVAAPNLPVSSVGELLKMARSAPGTFTYGSSGTGSPQHLFGAMLASMAGLQITEIPYKGGGSQLMPDLLTGRVSMSFFSSVIVSPYLKDKRLKALAVSTRTRMSTFPDVPTLSEAGVPGYHADQFSAIVGPPGVPEPIANRLQDAVMHSLKSPEFQARMRAQGTELQPGTGRELATLLRDEYVKWQKVIKDNNITAQ